MCKAPPHPKRQNKPRLSSNIPKLRASHIVVMLSHAEPESIPSLGNVLFAPQNVRLTPHTLRLPITFFLGHLLLYRAVGLTLRNTSISLVAFRPGVTGSTWY